MLLIETHAWRSLLQLTCLPRLQENSVHVWHRQINPDHSEISVLLRLLSERERLRAEHYKFDKHRNEFILSRGTLRILLAAYLDSAPESVTFACSEYGKPTVSSDHKSRGLHFNISHSDDIAVFAFARTEVGVDIEKVRTGVEHLQLADRFFSAYERAQLRQFSGRELDEAFFRCWTRKEAYVKGKGGGLSIPLTEFDVSLAARVPAALLATRPDAADTLRWTLHDLSTWPGYAAALAVCQDSI